MKTVVARLDIEIFVDCPNCENLIDLLNEKDTNGVHHNDDSAILKQAVPDGNWMDEHKKFIVKDVTCTSCKTTFNVKELEW